MAHQALRAVTATEPDELLARRALSSLDEFGKGLARIARIARSVTTETYGPQELRHLQRQVDRSVQELDGLAESSRYRTVHLWDPPHGDGNASADPDDVRRVRVRMLWPVPAPRHRLLVGGARQADEVLARVTAAQQVLALPGNPGPPAAGQGAGAGRTVGWQLEDEPAGVRAMVTATRLQFEALARLLRRPDAGAVPGR